MLLLGLLRRIDTPPPFFVAKFDLAIREHLYQFVDKDTADAMVVLEIEAYYPQLHSARLAHLRRSNQTCYTDTSWCPHRKEWIHVSRYGP